VFQFPRGKGLQRISPAELFRVQKPTNHWEQVRRSKQFLAAQFLPPFDVPLDANLRELFTNQSLTESQVIEKLVQMIPNLNHD